MTRNQIWATVGGVAAALVLGIAVVLVATNGGASDSISTASTRPTVTSTTTTTVPPTTVPPTTVPPTTPPTIPPTTPPPTAIIVPPTTPPTAPPTAPPTTPTTSAPPVTTTLGPPTTTTTVPTLAPTITKVTPLKGAVGTKIVITGTNLAAVDTVEFTGTIDPIEVPEDDVTIDSDTQITVVVPAGAITGKITVISAEGTGVSPKKFRVLPGPPTTTTLPPGPTPTSGAVAPTTTTTDPDD